MDMGEVLMASESLTNLRPQLSAIYSRSRMVAESAFAKCSSTSLESTQPRAVAWCGVQRQSAEYFGTVVTSARIPAASSHPQSLTRISLPGSRSGSIQTAGGSRQRRTFCHSKVDTDAVAEGPGSAMCRFLAKVDAPTLVETWSHHVMNGGEKCAVRRQPADQLEQAVWNALSEALRDPQTFIQAIDVTITDLKSRVADAEKDSAPLREALDDAESELARIERAWIRGRLSPGELREMEEKTEARKRDIQARLDALDPGRLAELEDAEVLLRGALDVRANAALRAERDLSMGDFFFGPEFAESDEMIEFREHGEWPASPRGHDDMRLALGKLLDRLHAEIVMFATHAEIRGLISVEAAIPSSLGTPIHTSHSSRGLR